MGAPLSRTRAYRLRAVGMLRYYAGQTTAIHGETIENSLPGEIFSYTLKEPVGVVGAIIPWNGPLTATIWKVGPAIATGCTVVLKPASDTPLTALLSVVWALGFISLTGMKLDLWTKGLTPILIVAMAAGSLTLSHLNDGGFWFVKEYFGMTVPETLKTWTVMETIISIVALALVLLLNSFL